MKKHLLYFVAGAFWLLLAALQYSKGGKLWPVLLALFIGTVTIARGVYIRRKSA